MYTNILDTLRKILFIKIIADDSLGQYGKMRLEYLYNKKYGLYKELLCSGELVSHCKYVQAQTFVVKKNIIDKYVKLGYSYISCSKAAEEIIISNLVGYK